ncbi:MAG TPA: hypothetical protein VI072_19555 [Polyangiaceae bacterium]
MQVLEIEVKGLKEKLDRAQELVSAAQQQCADVCERIATLVSLPRQDASEALEHLAQATHKHGEVLEAVRERGKGSGFQSKLDRATELDREQQRVVEQLRQSGSDPRLAKSALEYYSELERQQRELLMEEVGKFEGQGLRPLLDDILALAQQEELLVRELLTRATQDGADAHASK